MIVILAVVRLDNLVSFTSSHHQLISLPHAIEDHFVDMSNARQAVLLSVC